MVRPCTSDFHAGRESYQRRTGPQNEVDGRTTIQGGAGGEGSFPSFLTSVGGTLIFAADDGVHGSELWRSHGSEVGTALVEDVRPGGEGSFPAFVERVGATVFFRADDGVHGPEPWRSDGSEAGTALVEDIRPGARSSMSVPPLFRRVGGTIFFRADEGVHRTELWSLAIGPPRGG